MTEQSTVTAAGADESTRGRDSDPRTNRRYVGFDIDAWTLVTPVEALLEVAMVPKLAQVPGARPWIVGVGRARDALLPVVDLRRYFFDRPSVVGPQARLFVVRRDRIESALLVERVHGLMDVAPDDGTGEGSVDEGADDGSADDRPPPDSLRACLLKHPMRFSGGVGSSHVFDLSALLDQPAFRQGACAGAPAPPRVGSQAGV